MRRGVNVSDSVADIHLLATSHQCSPERMKLYEEGIMTATTQPQQPLLGNNASGLYYDAFVQSTATR